MLQILSFVTIILLKTCCGVRLKEQVNHMINRKIAVGVSCGLIVLGFICLAVMEREQIEETITANAPKIVHRTDSTAPKTEQPDKKCNLFSETIYNVPLSGIVEINKASEDAQKSAEKLLEDAQGFYFVKYDEGKKELAVLLENPVAQENTFSRHNLEFAYIKDNGAVKYSKQGYTGKDGETSNAVETEEDLWEFDKTVEPPRPLKHMVFGDNGKLEFTETWNYDEKEPVKYEMKDGDDKVISIMKETVDGTTYRKEHVFYDKDGKTKMSLSANYDGIDLSRLSYYNADNNDGLSIISEYSEGNKVKEVVYNQDYELKNTIKSEYDNDKRKSITILDSDSKEIETLSD